MISGTPWPPSAAGGANAAAKPPHAASPLQRTLRWVPAIILVLVCTTSFACVLLLVLLPTAGVFAPFGFAHALAGASPTTAYGALAAYAAIWVLVGASAVTVSRVPPGHIPLWLYSREPGDQAYFHNVLQAVEKKLDGSLRFCRKCGAFKPDLAHHSKQLGLCILCYQHWDIWANNAVGFYNHKMYLLTLGYGSLAHAVGAGLLLPGVLRAASSGGFGLSELPARVLLALWVGGDASVLAFACLALAASALLGTGSLCAPPPPPPRRTRALRDICTRASNPAVPTRARCIHR